jgi:hypothetical protein
MGAGARLAATAICLLIAGAASPAPATAARGGFKRLVRTRTSDPVLTDGRRWAAYAAPGHVTHVLDDRGPAYEVKTPAGCGLAGVGHGILMWQCREARGHYPVLFDLVHRRRLPAAGIDGLFADFDARTFNGPHQTPSRYDIDFVNVGREWVGGPYAIETSHGTFGVFALNWRTGERRYDRPRSASVWPNFDSPGFGQPLCSSLSRVIDQGYDQRIFLDFGYEGGYGVTINGSLSKLLLERCGRQPMVLDRCPHQDCDFWQLGAGIVTWQRGRWAFLYDIARRRRRVFSQRAFRAGVWPQHTRRSIFASVPIEVATRYSLVTRYRLYGRRL